MGVGVPHSGFLGSGEGNAGELSLLARSLARTKLGDLCTLMCTLGTKTRM